MSIGGGIGSSTGVAAETTYGTYVAATRFLEVDTSQLKKVKNTNQSDGLAANRLVELGAQRVVTSMAAAGPITMSVLTKGFGLILQHLMGGTGTITQQGATAAWLQVYALADNLGKFLTFQQAPADVTGTQRPYSFTGSKILSAEFSCGVDDILKVTFEVDCQNVSESQGLVAPSYVTQSIPFNFSQMGFKMGTFGAEAAVQGVKKVTLKIERPQQTGRFYANNAGLKSEPIMNGRVNISGSVDVDFVNKADFADRFAADTPVSIIWSFVGAIIASTFAQTFQIAVPMAFFDGDGQTIDGQDVLMQTYPFVGKNDGVNSPATVSYMSTDLAP